MIIMDDLDKTYPTAEYAKKVFDFSKIELEELKPLQDVVVHVQTMLALGQIAQKAEDNYVASKVLPRLGIKQSPDTKSIYDMNTGKVTVYEPKFWCSACDIRRAEFKYQDKPYCKDDIEKMKEEAVKAEPIKKKSKSVK